MSDVPIVGLPMRTGAPIIMIPITCLCRETNEPMVIRGVEAAVICPHCSNAYAITKTTAFDRQLQPTFGVSVSLVGKARA